MIIHFSHDPEPQLSFRSLSSFRSALVAAIAQGDDIDDLKPEQIIPLENQMELVSTLLNSASNDDETAEFLVCTYLPLLHPSEMSVLERLSSHENYFFREAVAVFLQSHPLPIHRALAELLAKDRYGQVARPAGEALKILRRNDRPR